MRARSRRPALRRRPAAAAAARPVQRRARARPLGHGALHGAHQGHRQRGAADVLLLDHAAGFVVALRAEVGGGGVGDCEVVLTADAVVDGNVVRILTRLTEEVHIFKNNGEAVKAFTARADELLDNKNPGDHNQAMMELGATVCLKHKPLCTVCPILKFCASNKNGTQNELPKIERKATVQVEIDRAWIVEDAKLLLHRIPESAGQLAGQYELPELSAVKARTSPQLIASKSRSITHRRIKEYIYETIVAGIDDSLEWVALDELEAITLSGPHRRWISELLKGQ